MKHAILTLCILTCSIVYSLGQENNSKLKVLNFHIGPSINNLINSEAPHKINIYGSDLYPEIITNGNVTESIRYFDYRTNIIKDSKINLIVGIGFEYYLKDDLSIYFSLNYDTKGIALKSSKSNSYLHAIQPNLPNTLPIPSPPSNFAIYNEVFEVNINNSYFILPLLLKKYLGRQYLYVQGGFYAGYLIKSKIYTYQEKHDYIPNYDFYGYKYTFSIDNEIDKRKEFTNNFDFGASLGIGFNYPLSKSLFIKMDNLINIGFRSIDKKYNNEFELEMVPNAFGMGASVRSTNYYGLNSEARNINMAFTLGLGLKI